MLKSPSGSGRFAPLMETLGGLHRRHRFHGYNVIGNHPGNFSRLAALLMPTNRKRLSNVNTAFSRAGPRIFEILTPFRRSETSPGT
jgi:hypothetical protein